MTLRRADGVRLIALLMLLGAGWIALRGAINQHYEASAPERIDWAVPRSGNAQLALAMTRIVAAGGVVDEPARALVSEAMAAIPAAGQPLALAGLAASASGDLPRATRLMEAARRRSPRLALARNWLLNEYVRTGRYADALAEAAPLMRLAAESRPQVYALIAAMAARSDSASAVAAALAARPDWAAPYEQWLAAQGQSAAGQ